MSQLKSALVLSALASVLPTVDAVACDLCGVSSCVAAHEPKSSSLRMGVAEQFSHFGEVQQDGHHVENEHDQKMNSSFTTFFGSYDFNERTSFQVNLPYISRSYDRIHDGLADSGTESGLGDVALLAKYVAYEKREANSVFRLQVFGGVELPTGDSDMLAEDHVMADESEETEHDSEIMDEEMHHEHAARHGGEEHEAISAIHGHDLALGSGSYDFPVGLNLFAKRERLQFAANVQYVFRTEGDHEYTYADDLTWTAGPAYSVLEGGNTNLALGVNLTGEHKGHDQGADGREEDTGMRSVFFGPTALLSIGENLSAEVSLELPLERDNNGFQTVAEYRVRGGLTWRF